MKIKHVKSPKKFDEIKSYFTLSLSTHLNSIKKLKKQKSHHNLLERPKFPKETYKLKIKNRELSNMLEQIGKEDDIFNDDKLLTNIRIETIEDSLSKNPVITSQDNEKSFLSKRTSKLNSSLVNLRKNLKKKKYLKQNRNGSKEIELNNDTLELNCNKMTFVKDISKISLIKKRQNRSNQNSRAKNNKIKIKNKNMPVKNVDQFINKPNNEIKSGNTKILISPLSKPSPIIFKHKTKVFKNDFHASQRKLVLSMNNSDTISLNSQLKRDSSKSFLNGKSVQEKTTNYMHFPNKSIIKNQDKVIIELQKLFGDKLQLSNDIYKNMTDLDKINSINFLLDIIKEMNNINKNNKSKIDGYRELNTKKEKQIKEQKTEIKGLKKEILKLNKIIKKDNQLNKKLTQNIETLKSQLEKEKEKNKSLVKERGKSSSKNINSYFNLKYKKEKVLNKVKKRLNKSQEIFNKANIYINQEKNENKNINENNLNKNINQNNINVKTNINIIFKNKEEKKDKEIEISEVKPKEEKVENV